MNLYCELKTKQQNETNAFPLGAAFSQKQFSEMMEKWNLDPEKDIDKILSLGYGCYIRKEDRDSYVEMIKRHVAEHEEAMNADKDGTGYIYDMFYWELANHEYSYTRNYTDTIYALGLSEDDIVMSPKLCGALKKAGEDVIKDSY